MLAPGETIDTIAASDLLVTFNWPEKTERYHRVANFVMNSSSEIRRISQTTASSKMEGSEHYKYHTGMDEVQSRAGLDRSLERAAGQPSQRVHARQLQEFHGAAGSPQSV